MTPTYASFGPCVGSLHCCYRDRGRWVGASARVSVAVGHGGRAHGQCSNNE